MKKKEEQPRCWWLLLVWQPRGKGPLLLLLAAVLSAICYPAGDLFMSGATPAAEDISRNWKKWMTLLHPKPTPVDRRLLGPSPATILYFVSQISIQCPSPKFMSFSIDFSSIISGTVIKPILQLHPPASWTASSLPPPPSKSSKLCRPVSQREKKERGSFLAGSLIYRFSMPNLPARH